MKLYHLDWKRAEAKHGDASVDLIMGLGSGHDWDARYLQAFESGLYDHVADIDGLERNEVFPATNNGILSPSWSREPPQGIRPVDVASDAEMRSTSVGDIIDDGGSLYVCAPLGWHCIREGAPEFSV